MFFRRERPKNPTFEDRLAILRQAGFAVSPQTGGDVLINRGPIGIVLRESGGSVRVSRRAGVVAGDEIANLVDGGFQKFFRTPSGKRRPALAGDLKAVHDFEEDLKEALGLVSLYNESLGTVSTFYLYDRVKGRDLGATPKPWDAAGSEPVRR